MQILQRIREESNAGSYQGPQTGADFQQYSTYSGEFDISVCVINVLQSIHIFRGLVLEHKALIVIGMRQK